MTDRKVSVVIPVYNAEKFIRRAVESALILPEVGEIIVVDDGYPDKALQICRELQAAHDKVKLFQHPDGKNQGPGATRNLGISKARFAFIAFLDADDFYLENRFTAWSEVVSSRPEVDGVYDAVGTTFYDDATLNIELKDGLTTIPSRPSGAALFELLLDPGHGHFHTNGITVKKSIIEKAGCFNTALWLHQDTDLWTKISYHGNIVPGETGKAVAIRGVHRNNRISSRNFESKGKLYRSLFEYFRQKNISKKAAWLIFRNYILFNKKPFGNRIMNNISNLLFAVITITRFPGYMRKLL